MLMLKFWFSCIFITLSLPVLAQINISGRVVDQQSGQGIANANIYVNNTSLGTSSDSSGRFQLKIDGQGKLELVVSHINYQKQNIVVLAGQSSVTISLRKSDNLLNEIVIRGKKLSKSKIANWTELFTNNLIGNYRNLQLSCKLKNPDQLYFDYSERKRELKVFAKGPLWVENQALGYQVRVDLDVFTYNFDENSVLFKYSLFFEDLAMPAARLQLIKQKRKSIYLGSAMHFMRSMYKSTTAKEGFKIYRYSSVQNPEYIRVSKIINKKIENMYANQTNPRIDLALLFNSRDTVKYYTSVMKGDRALRYDTAMLAPSQLLRPAKEPGLKNFYTADTLLIKFGNENLALGATKEGFTQFVGKNQQIQKVEKITKLVYDYDSYMYFFNREGVNIAANGYYGELGLYIFGNMGERRLAGMLPFDFEPDL